jgi:leader peptidase (prepilin peptidase)/N-methyltransferase
MIRTLGTVLAGLLGLAFGSFLNVCLSRWPEGESVVKPRSHCRDCGRTLTWWENIPVLSWLALRGRCRTCKTKISWRYPLVELAVGMLWGLVGWRLAEQIQSPELAANFVIGPPYFGIVSAIETMAFLFLLVGLAILDAEYLWIADAVTLPGIALGLALPVFFESVLGARLNEKSHIWVDLGQRVIDITIAAALVLFIRWIYWLIRRREGIGLGDAKLMAMLGAWLGISGALLSFAIGVMLGAVFALIALALPAAHRESNTWLGAKLPLGTFLCIGGIISALWGQPIIAAYLRWAGL